MQLHKQDNELRQVPRAGGKDGLPECVKPLESLGVAFGAKTCLKWYAIAGLVLLLVMVAT